MKKIRKMAMRYNAITYLYAAGAILLTAAPLVIWWVLLYGLGAR